MTAGRPSDPGIEVALTTLLAVARRLEAADRLVDPGVGAGLVDDPLLTAVAQTATAVLEAQAASIALYMPRDGRLVFVAAAGPAAAGVVGLGIDASAGIAGYAFATGQPLAVADVTRDPRFDRTIAEATGYVPRSLLATPLIDEGGAIGVLEVLDRRDGTFSLRDLDLAATLASGATIIVRRGQLGRDAARLLRDALTATVAADTGDGETDAGSTPLDIDVLVGAVAARMAEEADDPTWRLADQLARLIATDPDRLELAADWLDALLRRTDRRGGRSAPPGSGGR